MLWMGIWMHPPYTVTPVRVGVNFWKIGACLSPSDIVYCGVMVEAANPQRLHPPSILDVYKVFEHLEMLWMGLMPYYMCWWVWI